MNAKTNTINHNSTYGYADVNGINMYYEMHGKGRPLVLIHGGGSTIETSFGRVIHSFAAHRQIIAVELQAHGRTSDRDAPETFEQDAADVIALLQQLKVDRADFFGFSNGGNTTLQIAISYPKMVRKIVLGSVAYKRDGYIPQLFEGLQNATLKDMPQQLQDAYKKVAPNPDALITMFEKDRNRMLAFKDWSMVAVQAIKAPAFIIANDQDVVKLEHAVEMTRLLPNARLSIIPGFHGSYIGEVTTGMENSKIPELAVMMIEEFLDEPMP